MGKKGELQDMQFDDSVKPGSTGIGNADGSCGGISKIMTEQSQGRRELGISLRQLQCYGCGRESGVHGHPGDKEMALVGIKRRVTVLFVSFW